MRTPAEDTAYAAWLKEKLLEPWSGAEGGMPVGAIVPTGFEAYARVLPRAHVVPSWEPIRWAEVAAVNGRIAHPLMEWHLISTPAPGSGRSAATSRVELSEPGPLSTEELVELATALRDFTTTPERCWFCVWTGYGGIEERESGAEIQHPDRDYFVSSGSIKAVNSFEDDGPNIWWPNDRAWCATSEIDLAASYVGASADCIAGLLASERLEVLPVSVDDRVDINADVVNDD